MVLQSNFAKRFVSNAENTPPPSVLPSKSLSSRLRSSLHSATRRRRAAHNTSSKYTVEQAARRSRTKSPANSLKFKMRAIGGGAAAFPIPDVEMADASESSSTSTTSASRTVPVMLPKELGRPEYCEVSREALLAADPELADVEPAYLRDLLETMGPQMLKTLSSVRAQTTPDVLPKELSIVVHDLTTALPSHMLAVYGPAPKNPSPTAPKRKVTLYPVHSLYLAAHCARLPPFPPSLAPAPPVAPGATSVQYTVPVRPLCLPSPATYPRLSSYLYTKRTGALLASLLPSPPPAGLLSPSASDSTTTTTTTATREYATLLAQTYTPQALLQHALLVHGLWQNVCALGIFDDGVWEVIDAAWRTLLAGIALGTGADVECVLGAASGDESQ
ncbi:hypothetical protein LshimejAT787_0704430 [Lyophyllum shimeji]|uniref:Clp1-like protein n=1 Tax=Lyophyllum shimeji TaxID=47721 RepID=A0A9P3PQW4_LYOSH|nr:hypothetical protein LshimejAT787_0704430 [Lyophyllum shimeji]